MKPLACGLSIAVLVLSACGSSDDSAKGGAPLEAEYPRCPTGTYRMPSAIYGMDCYDGCNFALLQQKPGVVTGPNTNAACLNKGCPSSPPEARSPATEDLACTWTTPCGTVNGFTSPRLVAGAEPGYRWYLSSYTCPVDTTP